jgi:hypothetical protein
MAVTLSPSKRSHGIEMVLIAAGLSDSLSCFNEDLCSLNALGNISFYRSVLLI